MLLLFTLVISCFLQGNCPVHWHFESSECVYRGALVRVLLQAVEYFFGAILPLQNKIHWSFPLLWRKVRETALIFTPLKCHHCSPLFLWLSFLQMWWWEALLIMTAYPSLKWQMHQKCLSGCMSPLRGGVWAMNVHPPQTLIPFNKCIFLAQLYLFLTTSQFASTNVQD